MQGERLTIGELCESVTVSRASYYRNWRKKEPRQNSWRCATRYSDLP